MGDWNNGIMEWWKSGEVEESNTVVLRWRSEEELTAEVAKKA